MTYELTEVKELILAGRVSVVRSTAVDMVQEVLGCGPVEAERFCVGVVSSLNDGNYSGPVTLATGKADTYGKIVSGYPWFIKFLVDDGEVIIISCHLPQYDIETESALIRCTIRPGRL